MHEKIKQLQQGKIWGAFNIAIRFLLIFCSIASVVLIFSAVIARYVFHRDIYGIEEIILTIAFWLYFAGSVSGSMEDSHIKADILDVYVSNHRVKYLLKAVAKLVEVIVYIVFSKWAINLFMLNLQRMPRTTGLKIPLVAAQVPIAAGFVLMTLFAFYYGLLYLTQVKQEKPLKGEG
ncbi:MAG: TRAP transporter small permease [Bacillota bacterium]